MAAIILFIKIMQIFIENGINCKKNAKKHLKIILKTKIKINTWL